MKRSPRVALLLQVTFTFMHSIGLMWMQKFCKFAHLKPIFFYFIHSFLQNTYISLSILHIYLIKFSFFYNFFNYFLTHCLSLSLSLSLSLPLSLSDPTTIITHPDRWTDPFKTHWSCWDPKPCHLVTLGPWRHGFRRSQQHWWQGWWGWSRWGRWRGWRGLEPEGEERRKKKQKQEREKINKIINASVIITVHICMVTIVILHAYFYTHWCGCFLGQNV